MVNNLLMALIAVTLLVWLAQELVGRRQQERQLELRARQGGVATAAVGGEPAWSDWAFKCVMVLWLGWLAVVLLVKDGDFAFVLVMLTLLSGLVAALDRWWFQRRRETFAGAAPVAEYCGRLNGAQAEEVRAKVVAQRTIAEYSRSFFPVLAVVLVLRSFVVEPFQIPSSSMVPTLEVGDYILVSKFSYGLRLPVLKTKILNIGEPQRGDVVVFFPPNDTRYFIKRLVGLPGDHIQYRHKVLYVNGVKAEQTLLAELPPTQPREKLASEKLGGTEHLVRQIIGAYNDRADVVDVTVQPGHYFMMGDNRDNSSDSRFWGQVPEANIVGKAFAIWMHWESLELPGFNRVGRIH
jgi:signal peptidase I